MKLTVQERRTINHLARYMMLANAATPYDGAHYDAYKDALYAFLRSLCGDPLFEAIENSKENWNWHGCRTFGEDAQTAIDFAIKSHDYDPSSNTETD